MVRKTLCLALIAAGTSGLGMVPAIADGASEGLERAKATLQRYTEKPEFTAPGEAFDMKACAAGKKMLSMPTSSGNAFLKGIIEREINVGKDIGLDVQEWESQGQPSQWIQGFDYAVREKFDVIDLISGIDPESVAPAVRAARDAGVKVMTSHFYDPSDKQSELADASLTIGFNEIGTILANWATVNTEGNANIMLLVLNEAPPTAPLVKGFKDTLAANCPKCRIIDEINTAVAEWATKIQPAVQSSLQANPEINVIVPIYDSMSLFVAPALRLTGNVGKVKVATFNGTPAVLDLIRSGEVTMDIGESLDWIAYATVDGYMRALCGAQPPAALNVPFYIFDASNIDEVGNPAEFDKGFGDAYKEGFRKLWGLQ